LRRLRKIAAKRDDLIAREQAKVDAEKALAGPSEAPVRRRRRPTEEVVE
jgi:DNA-directed RNA polymerase subunit beta'